MLSPRAVVGAVAVSAGVFTVLQLSSWSALPAVRVVNDVAVALFALTAAACVLVAARGLHGSRRIAWLWVALGLCGFAAGQLVWAYNGLTNETLPFHSLADVGYLLLSVGMGLALVVMLREYPRSTMLRVLLDAVVVAGALFGVAWVGLLATVYTAKAMDWASLVLTLIYPVASIAVVTIALLMLVRVSPAERLPAAMLIAGLVSIWVADMAYAYATAVEGRYYEAISLGYVYGFIAIGASAMVTRDRAARLPAKPAPMSSSASAWLPFVPMTVMVLVGAPVMAPRIGPLYVVGAVTVLAVVIRQMLVLRDNRGLLAEVSERALRDPLTGLANRTLFVDRLTHALTLQKRESRAVAVLLIDLDDFKLVNDRLGHSAGDAILARAAERLNNSVRASDTVARLGGDEFAVLMEGDPDSSRAVAHQVVAAFELPFLIDGRDLLVRPSVGLAITTPATGATTVEELLKQADVAMYRAKRAQTSEPFTFAPGMELQWGEDSAPPTPAPPRGHDSGVAGRESLRLLRELRVALDNDDLSVVYQPKLDLRSGHLVGVEALVRWQHPRRGLLTPDQFLSVVRRHGLMRAVTAAVLEQALDDAAHWWAQGAELPVAINVFAPAVGDLSLPRQLSSALARRGLPPEMLTVEITEDLLLENLSKTREVLTMLREHGIRIAIDDFGSGYSALSYLRELPVDELKLDRHFIAPILEHPAAEVIVRAVIDLAHALGITPVAEGVENAQTAQRLVDCGCTVGQGYYYSKPLSADAVLELVRAERQRARIGEKVDPSDVVP